MSAQRVLIVDDSKTAQIRLKKMLKRYDIDVDVAFSAEEALDYLGYRMPAVIFLDHHMEGMDGLEALKIIKATPRTAMIPVIMYTSQSGDVYVGQARALGALDILSKEVIKPASVDQVLSRLNIFPGKIPAKSNVKQDPNHKMASVTKRTSEVKPFPNRTSAQQQTDKKPASITSATSVSQLRKQVAGLFEIHVAELRSQISESTKFVVRQLSGEIQRVKIEQQDDESDDSFEQDTSTATAKGKIFTNAVMCLILLGVITIGVQLLQSHGKLAELADRQTELVAINTKQNTLLSSISTNDGFGVAGAQYAINHGLLLDTISWAMDTDMTFPYAHQPLGDTQVEHLQQLVNKLDSAGFNGLIKLNIHYGNFCVKRSNTGTWAVANSGFSFSQCIFAQDVQQPSAEDFVSPAYLQFLQNSPPIQNGNIAIALDVKEFNTPIKSYPLINNSIAVTEWNAIAAHNNRLSVEFELESESLTGIMGDY